MKKSRADQTAEISKADLKRGRSAVINVLVFIALGIALSGIALARRPVPAPTEATREIARQTYGGLVAVVLLSSVYKTLFGFASDLQDPKKFARFRRARFASALIASSAVPVGFAHGYYVRPTLDGVAPFWIAAVALCVLALPKRGDFAEAPVSSRQGGTST